MQIVPLLAVPAQNVKTVLADQIVNLSVYQRRYGLFIDVYIDTILEIGGVVCENMNRIIRSAYLNEAAGFSGDFVFFDSQGSSDPTYAGLGSRFQLVYLSKVDLAAMGLSA